MGGKIEIPTIDGNVELNIPTGTQPGDRKALRKRGLQRVGRNGERGDQWVTLKVQVPTKLTAKQKELLLEAFGEKGKDKDASGSTETKKGIFENIFGSSKKESTF